MDVDADGVAKVLTLPDDAFNSASPVYFVRLTLDDRDGKPISTNFYWLSSKKNTYNWGKTTYRFTPVTSYEDMTALETLPKTSAMNAAVAVDNGAEGRLVRVTLKNPSDHLAFQVHVAIRHQADQMEILPVLWDDNYIELMPGESREITARFLTTDALKGGAQLNVTGWNIEPSTVPVAAGSAAGQSTGTRGR